MCRGLLLLLLSNLFCSLIPVHAQDTTIIAATPGFIFNTHHYKKGVYKNFQEFQQDNPSITGNLVLKNRSSAAQIYLLASRNELRVVDSTGQERKVKDYWGFSDGNSVYIRDNGLNRIKEIGYYCLYEIGGLIATPLPQPGALTFKNTPPPVIRKKVINILTGDIYELSLYNLRKYILPEDKVILEAFNQDEQKREKLEYYIQWFNQRNTPVL
ncbi:hypothetical protein F0L74_03225 [Chitinophaga agrisoli]|uniref:GLPGLI family protein n=1 Tax=Chitinophaga agrisoli TaxID=2607653 RepID=A0A5B2W2A2_9BACT|nr:hypothetical protein [Chitinophaga agrisoli]KAA2244988.1 hypothetical protein F0L74_03225 [Chitinophaga agrisoli]